MWFNPLFSRFFFPFIIILYFINPGYCLVFSNQSLFEKIHPLVPLGHSDSVYAIDFSPDGRLAFSLAYDQVLRVWEVETGREIKRFSMQSDWVKALAVSPDGLTVLSGGTNREMRLRNIASGETVLQLDGHSRQINTIQFSTDGRFIISAGNDRIIKRWDTETGELLNEYRGHQSPIKSVVYSKNGKWLTSAAENGEVIVWDVQTKLPVKKFIAHQGAANSVVFLEDERLLASSGADGQIFLWDWRQAERVGELKGHEKTVNSIDISVDGRQLLSASDDKTIRIWDLTNQQLIRKIKAHQDKVIGAKFSPNGHFVLSGSSDNSLQLWGAVFGNPIMKFEGYASLANSLTFSKDGKWLFSGHQDRTLKLWDMENAENIKTYSRHDASVNSLAVSGDKQWMVSGSSDNTIKLWRVNDGLLDRTLEGHQASVNQVLFSPDHRQILSASADRTIKLWSLEGRILKSFVGHKRSVTAIAYAPDGRSFLSASKDKTLRQWNVKTGQYIQLNVQPTRINSIQYSNNGQYAVTAGWEAIVWEMPSAKIKTRIPLNDVTVTEIKINQQGTLLAIADWSGAIKLWDLKNDKFLDIKLGHVAGVQSIDFSPDGNRLISASMDGTIKLWNLHNGEEIVTMIGADNGEWITLTTDGYYNHSPEGTELIHWVEKNGVKTYSFEQFEQYYKKPDIIKGRLSGLQQLGKPAPIVESPPQIEVAEHLFSVKSDQDEFALNLKILSDAPADYIHVFVNGKPVIKQQVEQDDNSLTLSVPLFSGANQLTMRAYNQYGLASEPKFVNVYSTVESKKPDLHIMAIGVSQYKKLSSDYQLTYAHSDAENFIKRFQKASASVFENINYEYLYDKRAGLQSIIDSLGKFQSLIDKDDLVLMFFAGHGVKSDKSGEFYLLTHDSDPDDLSNTAINWDLLTQRIKDIKSRVIIFLDACHSGSITRQTTVPNNELAEKLFSREYGGVMVFSAAKGRQYAFESNTFGEGEGLFSYGLSRALSQTGPEVDFNGNGILEFSELVSSVRQFVDQQSDGQQTPWLSHKSLFGDVPLAKIKH